MLLYIDKTIGEAIELGELSEAEIATFQCLAVAAQKGCCIISGEYHSLATLANRTDNIGNVFKKVLSKYATHRAIIEKVNQIFCICKNASKELPCFIANKAVEIPIDKIVGFHWDFFQKCILLCENSNDCNFYFLLGKNYCNRNQIIEYTVDFMLLGGGGQTTANQYHNMVCKEKRPVLCIVDSDKRYGNSCLLGNTAVAVKKVATEFPNLVPPFYTIVLPVHEVENMVPLTVLAEIYKTNPLIHSYINLLKDLSKIDNGKPFLCYDLKMGHSFASGTDDMAQYWKNIATSSQVELSEFKNAFPAMVNRGYLPKAIESLQKMIEDAKTLEFEECLESIILQLEQDIFSWGCVSHPMFV